MGILVQVICTFILGTCSLNVALNLVWPSSTILIFKSENTTLNRPMSNVEIGLFSSLPACGSLVAVPLLIGTVLDRLGRKRTTILTSSLLVIAWSIKAVTNRVEAILFAAFISGFGNALFILVFIYTSEIVQDSIRGTLTSGITQFASLGLLLSYLLGGMLEYEMMVYTYLSLTVFSLIMVSVLRDSPTDLMSKGLEQEAAKSLAFYRQVSVNSKEVEAELKNIRRALSSDANEDHNLSLIEQNHGIDPDVKKMSRWQLFKSTPSIRRQFYVVLVLNTVTICQGLSAVQVYAQPMFYAALGDAISPNLCTIIFAVVSLVAGLLTTYLCDKVGRRPLQIYSSIVSGICCTGIATQLVTDWFPKVTIPLLICVFGASHTLGVGTVSYVVAAEIFLPEVKSVLLMLSQEWSLICQFCSYFLFNIIVESIGLSTVFFFFSFVCFLSTFFFVYCLPETKGLSVHAIQLLFDKKMRQ